MYVLVYNINKVTLVLGNNVHDSTVTSGTWVKISISFHMKGKKLGDESVDGASTYTGLTVMQPLCRPNLHSLQHSILVKLWIKGQAKFEASLQKAKLLHVGCYNSCKHIWWRNHFEASSSRFKIYGFCTGERQQFHQFVDCIMELYMETAQLHTRNILYTTTNFVNFKCGKDSACVIIIIWIQ